MIAFIPILVKHWKLAFYIVFFAALIIIDVLALHRAEEVSHLRSQISSLQVSLEVERAKEASDQVALRYQALRLSQRTSVVSSVNGIIERSRGATKQKDGPVAPVLRDALSALGKLRTATSTGRAFGTHNAKRAASVPIGSF